ncbi:MAG: hypothetical protein A2X03_09815 [Bacteroidetes bacterium GWA2_40_15]|nr:MAG: hypothetical protein A2X03_09815 [Bacteroidetes bacterium GWA2_40_15]HBQ81411.1 hypothetical protein [Bacteroidales bacterium]
MISYLQFQRSFSYCVIILLVSFSDIFAQEERKTDNEFLPDLDGVIKAKYEYDFDNNLMRFDVRNARFGAKGKINPFFSYRTELDLNDEGRFKVLEAFVRFTPVKNLDFVMGQRKIQFSTDHLRSPADLFFANRSFTAKYMNEGMRDIGFYTSYKKSGSIPAEIILGVVNGTGNNNPQWVEKPNFVGRLLIGPEQGIRIAGNYYNGKASLRDNLSMYGGEIRFTKGSLLIESEYIKQNYTDTASVRINEDGLYIHSYYIFRLNNKIMKMIYPTARWDFMGDDIFKGETDANRITLGVNAGFEPKPFLAEIRVNYENYFCGNLPIHTDKITLEFVVKF